MKKLDDRQVEKLMHAMDYVRAVRDEIEESGGSKRTWNKLDKVVGTLYDVICERR